MSYKISGSKNDTARIFIVNEATNTLETQVLISGTGSYEITGLATGRKLIVARKSDGRSYAYGYIDPIYYYVYEPGNRGVIGGSTAFSRSMEYITISTLGNAQTFGNLITYTKYLTTCASSIRGIFSGGKDFSDNSLNFIEYITISTPDNATDFGDLTIKRYALTACANNTRGVFGGGGLIPGNTIQNVLDYITIATAGNAGDFGDLTFSQMYAAACSSPTRGVYGAGYPGSGSSNVIAYITINTAGNAADFGDLTVTRYQCGACSSSTRGLFGGGWTSTVAVANTIQYVTIATTGNAIDFGELSVRRGDIGAGSCSSLVRGIWVGGSPVSGSPVNIIDYVTIATTGNAIDFGDITNAGSFKGACSDGHGGLA